MGRCNERHREIVRRIEGLSIQIAQLKRAVNRSSAPYCPRCSSLMALRQNRKTFAAFWGGTNFRYCGGTISIP